MLEFLDISFQIITQTKALAYLFGGAIIFSLFLFISARVPFWLRFVGIPVVLSLTIWGYSQLDNMLGYPYWGLPTTNTVLLGHDIQRKEGQLEIVIWVREGDTSRLYLIPWSQKKEEQLKRAAGEMKRGKVIGIRKIRPGEEPGQKKKRGKRGNEADGEVYRGGEFILHNFEEFLYPDKET